MHFLYPHQPRWGLCIERNVPVKNWETLEPDKYNLLTKNFSPGRGGESIKFITLHHMAMVGGVDECVRVWSQRPASAHYCIGPTGEIGQAVNDWDTAWANANLLSNQRSIAIEHSNSAGASQDWPIGRKPSKKERTL